MKVQKLRKKYVTALGAERILKRTNPETRISNQTIKYICSAFFKNGEDFFIDETISSSNYKKYMIKRDILQKILKIHKKKSHNRRRRRKSIIITLIITSYLALNLLNPLQKSFAKSPYHVIDQNNYESVVRALKKPIWLEKFARYNFEYETDQQHYNKDEWFVSGKTMFYRKKGDCDDWAAFFNDVLQHHNIKSEQYFLFNHEMGHVVTIYEYKGLWGYLGSAMANTYESCYGYKSKEETLDNAWSGDVIISIPRWGPYNEESDSESTKKLEREAKNDYIGIDRLDLHKHLTECEDGVYVYSPLFSDYAEKKDYGKSDDGYYKFPNKEAIGYLHKINSHFISGIGASFSLHGYYSTIYDSEQMLSLHATFLDSRLGISVYGLDFNGIDIDFNMVNERTIKTYICFRNYYEIIDIKTVLLPFWFLKLNIEKIDKCLLYGSELYLFDGINFIIDTYQIGLGFDTDSFDMKLLYKQQGVKLNLRFSI